jgi:hypothetical protein
MQTKTGSKSFIFLKNLKKNSTGIYWFMILALLAMEVFVVKDSVSIILGSKKEGLAGHTGGVKINFTDYQAIVQRMQRAESYKPPVPIEDNPFNHSAIPVEIIRP